MHANNPRAAFTLAEVLIALTIIGVVSALTIPTLVQKTNKQEYVSALQKAYSTLSQATQQIIAEEGSPKADENGESWLKSHDTMYSMYKKYLHNVRECGSGTGCFTEMQISGYKCLQSNSKCESNWDTRTDFRKLILADGIQMIVQYWTNACSGSWAGTNNLCGLFYVDVNGEKKPNRFGRDVFIFALKKDSLVPAGCDNGSCPDNYGGSCACKVLREGRMDY